MGGNKGGVDEARINGRTGTRKTRTEDQCCWQARHFGGYKAPLGAQTRRSREGATSQESCTKDRCEENCKKGSDETSEEDCGQGTRKRRPGGACRSIAPEPLMCRCVCWPCA